MNIHNLLLVDTQGKGPEMSMRRRGVLALISLIMCLLAGGCFEPSTLHPRGDHEWHYFAVRVPQDSVIVLQTLCDYGGLRIAAFNGNQDGASASRICLVILTPDSNKEMHYLLYYPTVEITSHYYDDRPTLRILAASTVSQDDLIALGEKYTQHYNEVNQPPIISEGTSYYTKTLVDQPAAVYKIIGPDDPLAAIMADAYKNCARYTVDVCRDGN